MNRTPRQDLVERLKDPEYAKLYGVEQAKVDFAITLAKARKGANLTQKGLSEKLSISQPYVAKLEGAEANPTLGTIGRLLAAINLRLVTGTAPLKPEPVPPSRGFVWVGAADATDPVLYLRTCREIQEGWSSIWRYSPVAVNAGTMAGTIPLWPTKSEPREALIGGAAK